MANTGNKANTKNDLEKAWDSFKYSIDFINDQLAELENDPRVSNKDAKREELILKREMFEANLAGIEEKLKDYYPDADLNKS